MAEKQDDGADNKDAAASTKKKKTKSRVSSRTEVSGMSSSGKGSSSPRESIAAEGGSEEQRRRSRSTDQKARRDSGSRRNTVVGVPGSRALSGSGRLVDVGEKSPPRARKPRNVADHKMPTPKGERTANASSTKDRGRSRSPSAKERARSRSPTANTKDRPTSAIGQAAPRLPQRTVSESSSLLQETLGKGNVPDLRKDNYEEASLGDYHKYAAKQEQKQQRLGPLIKMGEIPEESLGSFTAFHRKYEQEKLLGLHDDDDDVPPRAPKTQESKQQEAAQQEQSASLGTLLNPMKQYGGYSGGKPKSIAVEESLGSFAALQKKPDRDHDHDQLLGLKNSSAENALFTETLTPKKKMELVIPEESLGDFVQMATAPEAERDRDDDLRKPKAKKGEEKEFDPSCLPSTRIKNLGKRGGIGYRIMVDTPGGHAPEPMRIVVAIEFDETDSDKSDDDENVEPADKAAESETEWERQPKAKLTEQNNEMNEVGHSPRSAVGDVATKDNAKAPHRKMKQPSKMTDDIADAKQQKHTTKDDGNEDDSDDDDEIGPLATSMNRWNNQSTSIGGSLRQPERESSTHSHSTRSTVSSVTLESVLENAALVIQTDACPSNANVLQRQPVGRAKASLSGDISRRSSGALQLGGTATLLRPVGPHNLGTRRGLMLRQMSEASMKSTGTSKSNDSSWVGNNSDTPEDYQASFMQLNLMDLDKTQIQTNETVQQTQLPDELLSGIEGIERGICKQQDGLEPIPEGKDPQAAASELLGMKTMLKHIKRVAPKRSLSFEFDRDMPKQMWNKMFAKSQKGALAGSQYVDNDDSTEEDKIESAKEEDVTKSDSHRAPGSRSTDDKLADKSGLRGNSLWNSVIKRVIPSTSTDVTQDEAAPPEAAPSEAHQEPESEGMEVSERSLDLEGILQELDQSLGYGVDGVEPEETDGPTGQRRRATDKGNEGSGRGPRSGHSRIANEVPKKGGAARSRAARNQHVHNRSLRDTLDYLSAEHDDDELPNLDAIKEEDGKKKSRVRGRRKPPLRTRSDESAAKKSAPGRAKSSDGTRGGLGRTRSHDGSPVRPSKRATERMHSSFSSVEHGELPLRQKASKDIAPRAKSIREGPSGHQHKENPGRIRADTGPRRSLIRKHRPVRKKSGAGADDAESSGHVRGVQGVQIPVDATENEVRELLDYH